MTTRRAVITGIGAITPLGNGREATWKALCAGRSGIGPISSFDTTGLPVRIAAEVEDFDPGAVLDHRRVRRSARMSQFAVGAAQDAALDADFDGDEAGDGARVGVVVNSAVAGMGEIADATHALDEQGQRRVSPYFVSSVIPNMPACEVAIDRGAHGPVTAGALACASGLQAVLDAADQVRAGRADVMFAGGTDSAITPVMFAGLSKMGALSTRNDDPTRASRPFDANRDGFVFGEGAVVLVIESEAHAAARGVRPYAEVLGGSLTSDAFHVSAPAPSGEYALAAVNQALEDSAVSSADVDYVCAHGTSTPINDRLESGVLRDAFGSHAGELLVSSPKSMTGHVIGAAGALSAMTCALSIRDGVVPPTINLDTPDPECDLDYVPNVPREASVRATMANAFGFGGQNSVALFGAT